MCPEVEFFSKVNFLSFIAQEFRSRFEINYGFNSVKYYLIQSPFGGKKRMKARKVLPLIGICFLWSIFPKLLAQDRLVFEQDLALVHSLLHRFQNDSALIYLQPLFQTLETEGLVNSPLALKAKLAKGIASRQKKPGRRCPSITQ